MTAGSARVGQPELLEARAAGWPAGRPAARVERSRRPARSRTSSRVTSTCNPPPISREPLPGRLTVSRSGASLPSRVSLTCWQVRTSTAQCRGSRLPPGVEPLFHVMGQGQVEVVAAEDQVLADGHAVELYLAVRARRGRGSA